MREVRNSFGAKMTSIISFCRAHKRTITFVSIPVPIFALAIVAIAYGDYFDLITLALFLLFIASQVFWIGRIVDLGERLLPGQLGRARIAVIADLVYLFVIAYSFPATIGQGHTFRIGLLPAFQYRVVRGGFLVVVRRINAGFCVSRCFRDC